jgi:hypothetical protein
VILSIFKKKSWVSSALHLNALDRRFIIFSSISLFIALAGTYNIVQYRSFGVLQVATAMMLFVGLFLIYVVNNNRGSSWKILRPANAWSYVWSALIVVFAWLSSFPIPNKFTSLHYPTFPLNEVDSGGRLSQDTMFHESLIQSIMHFGYPSTGLNGVPWAIYHTLSHYVDALFLTISGLEPLDSAGLFFRLKLILLIASLLLLVGTATVQLPPLAFFAAILVGVPAFAGTWHAVGSHSLWLTTFILILTARFTFTAITAAHKLTGRTLIALGVIGIVLSLGKISSGFMYILVVGVFLVLDKGRDLRIYILGSVWLLFLSVYSWLFALDRTILPTERVDTLWTQLEPSARLLLLQGNGASAMLPLYSLATFLAVYFVLYRRKSTRNLLVSLGLGIFGIAVLAFLRLHPNDVWYFGQGLFYAVLLMTFLDFVAIRGTQHVVFSSGPGGLRRYGYVILTVVAVLSTAGMSRPVVSLFSAQPAAIVSVLTGQVPAPAGNAQGVAAFRSSLYSYMHEHDYAQKNSLLFIPTSVWERAAPLLSSPTRGHAPWANSLLVYSATGVPLINGVVAWSQGYGFASYATQDFMLTESEFQNTNHCELNKNVIEVVSWYPAAFATACETRLTTR